MKRKWMSLLLAAVCLTSCIGMETRADELKGGEGWKIQFTPENELSNNFKWAGGYVDGVSDMLPGDTIEFTLTLENANENTVDWYMTNEVINSLEHTENENAAGGAYTYILTYRDSSGNVTELYNNDKVGGTSDGISANAAGGESAEGLQAATQALKDHFYLDTLKFGQSGVITLRIALDGETQGNSYQNTLANLQMNFAVEIVDVPDYVDETVYTTAEPIRNEQRIIRTGDDTNLLPFYIAMGVSGVLLMALAVFSLISGKKVRKEAK